MAWRRAQQAPKCTRRCSFRPPLQTACEWAPPVRALILQNLQGVDSPHVQGLLCAVRTLWLFPCRCKPGFGSRTGQGKCRRCPINTWSAGGSMEECAPCPFGTSSRPGSISESQCYAFEACPAGTEVHKALTSPASLADCV
jgi:hypothetical protein